MATPTYPATLVGRARELHAADWNSTEIARIIARETDGRYQPSRNTVYRWIDPDYAAAERARKRTGRPKRSRRKAWRFVFDRIEEMRRLGMSYRAIAVLVSHDFDLSLTDEQVERMLQGRMRESTMAELLWPKGASS